MLLIAVIFVVAAASFSSCGRQQDPAAMTLVFDGENGAHTTVLSSNMYGYFLSVEKTRTLMSFYRMNGFEMSDMPNMPDMPEFWSQELAEGVTFGDLTKFQAESYMMRLLAMASYCKEHNLELPRATRDRIDDRIKEITRSRHYGNSKARFNANLIRFGINDSIYREIQRLEALAGVLNVHLFDSETGIRVITDEIIDQVYQEACIRFKHLFLPNIPTNDRGAQAMDVDGELIYYTAEELDNIKAKVDDWYYRIITDGEDIEKFYPESADTFMIQMPPGQSGYTVSDTSVVPPIPGLVEAAFELEIGETRRIETEAGFHVIKRYELLPAQISLDLDETMNNGGNPVSWAQTIDRLARTRTVEVILRPFMEKIEINTEETDLFRVPLVDVMFDCMYLWY
jgi:hypothetical protein